MADQVIQGTRANFHDTIRDSRGVVVVDFWAPWCGPCRALGPTIDALAAELAGEVAFVKVNVDEEQELAQQHAVSSIPTLVFYHDGRAVGQAVGALPRASLLSAIRTVRDRAEEHAHA